MGTFDIIWNRPLAGQYDAAIPASVMDGVYSLTTSSSFGFSPTITTPSGVSTVITAVPEPGSMVLATILQVAECSGGIVANGETGNKVRQLKRIPPIPINDSNANARRNRVMAPSPVTLPTTPSTTAHWVQTLRDKSSGCRHSSTICHANAIKVKTSVKTSGTEHDSRYVSKEHALSLTFL